jgi:hypothetical protein
VPLDLVFEGRRGTVDQSPWPVPQPEGGSSPILQRAYLFSSELQLSSESDDDSASLPASYVVVELDYRLYEQ